ncbi:uncharacterized protein BYT42DRAFT_637572 [Radiomyces spectabilis]|uniref:uncharacterized protein n=1 Tax=Radiomyces spectabilis TaxID=64574 RepID=UPI0022211552|nr:uncharacterized protein BYT42DRAFT_637572 [Radiomyces spectabilis]KAI8377937.1 hypothetical protein BYT42DRAFT_637572 [Radiomyces spectabilis]
MFRIARPFSTRAASFPTSRITPALEKKLLRMGERHDSLLSQLSNNQLGANELTHASKELASLSTSKSLFEQWQQQLDNLKQLQDLLSTQPDQDMIDMAKEEYEEITNELTNIERDLLTELAPKDAADDASGILEIRAGAGGEEASLFSADMARMYERFAQLKRWKWEILSSSEDAGGKGVQRVPATETQGRIHTSTVTVAMLPQPTEVDVQIRDSDLRIDVYRASGAGGQHVNTTDSAVRITHIPTGLVVSMQDERSQHKNKLKALKVLRAKIYEQEREKTASARRDSRNKQIGTGDRSEKIRTYNFPQNRVTDHRINLTLHELEPVLSGEGLTRIIEPLQEHFLAEALSE